MATTAYLGVDAQHASRVFYISPGKTVTISGLTIMNGSAPAPDYFGGGIYNDHASLTLSSCIISNNSAVHGAWAKASAAASLTTREG